MNTGMVSVIYEDKDGEVTELLPYLTFNDEYKLPKLGEKVLVVHLSNGSEMGIVLGTYWNKHHAAGNLGEYHKDLGEGAYLTYKENTLFIAAKHIELIASADGESVTIVDLMKDIRNIKEALNIT